MANFEKFDPQTADMLNQKILEKGWGSKIQKGTKTFPYQINDKNGDFRPSVTGRHFPLQGVAYRTKEHLLFECNEYLDLGIEEYCPTFLSRKIA